MRAENEQVYTARCSKLVVLAAGAFGSPAILERSGIGGSELLQSMDIPCRVELLGVGENYLGKCIACYIHLRHILTILRGQDHNLIFLPMMGAEETDSMDTIFHMPGCEQYEGNAGVSLRSQLLIILASSRCPMVQGWDWSHGAQVGTQLHTLPHFH